MAIIGIDLSLTSTGLVQIGRCKESVTTIKTKPKDGSKIFRYEKIRKEIMSWVRRVDYVFIENYAFKINPKQTSSIVSLAELGGIVKWALTKRTGRIPFVVSPSTLKLFVSGHGHSKKEEMRLAAYKKWGKEFENSDECDAYGLALLGSMLIHGPDKEVLAYEKRCIDTVIKANPDAFEGVIL